MRLGTVGWIDHFHAGPKGPLGPPEPRCPSLPVVGWEGSPTKVDYRKSWFSYSNLSNLEDLVPALTHCRPFRDPRHTWQLRR